MTTKGPSLDQLIDRLRRDLGPNAFDIVDQWARDPHATGLAAPWDHHVLAYVSVTHDQLLDIIRDHLSPLDRNMGTPPTGLIPD